jgi:hypothetical protein
MAICLELESCYPDINPSILTSSNLSQFIGKYVKICEACYLVKNSTATNCTTEVEAIAVSYDTCEECYQNSQQGACGSCPEFYQLVILEDGTEVCQAESSYPATWTGENGIVEPGDRIVSYSVLGLSLIENVTNKVWPIVGHKFYSFAPQTCPPAQLDPACDGPGFWANWGYKDDWGTGSVVFGQLGYSVYDNFTPTPTQAKTSAIDTNALFRSSTTTFKGRLNTAGIWARNDAGNAVGCSGIAGQVPDPNSTLEQFIAGNSLQCTNLSDTTTYIRYDFCFNAPTEREYLIGFAADNAVRLILDGSPFFVLVGGSATSRKFGAGCDNLIIEPAFMQWHVVPITLSVGTHTITMIGYNDPFTEGNYAAEVYNLTSQELKDQFLDINLGGYNNAVAALEPYILFSTKSFIDQGAIIPIGEGEWSCLDGSTADPCSQTGQPECDCVSNIPPIPCCYKLTNCATQQEIYTQVDLSQYQGQVVNIQGSSNCYEVEQLDTPCPQNTQTVVVTSNYADCETCELSYKLYNCKDQNVTLQTASVAFEAYLGKVVNLVEYPGDCWQVGPNEQKTLPLIPLTVDGQPFDTCEECDPKEFGLTNCVNGLSVISTVDLSAYVGKVVKADNFPGLCFIVEENPCNCLKITINGQVYNIDREENFFNGKPYFQFLTVNQLPIVIAYDSNELRWEVYNPETQVVYFYSNLNMDCPTTSVWTKLDPTFPGNITTEVCTLRILNISPTEEFDDCECCVNC